MSTPIPMPLRAAAGLAAVAIDSARKLPQQLVGFPVLAVSAALQASLKVQQQYAELVARGDQLLSQLRGPQEGTPEWARFDDDEPAAGDAWPRSAFDAVPDPGPDSGPDQLEEPLDEEAAGVLGTGEPVLDPLADAELEAVAAAAEPPVPGYDRMTIPQLRGRLRTLDADQLELLVAYERANGARAPYLTMLENRLTTLRSH